MTTPHYWEAAKKHLSANDAVMKGIISSYKGESLRKVTDDIFYSLARAIVGQQISVKAADTVWGRFVTIASHPALDAGSSKTPHQVRGVQVPSPAKTLKLKDEQLRGIGFSASKVKYIKSVAEFCLQNNGHWHDDDEEVIKHLTSIKGVGRWTAEMFLIFYLQRPNVLPLADLGLLKAFEKHYKKERKAIEKHSKKWHPYRSVATWYLWRSLDPVPVEY
jgi:DNA-3-methyladenine glycosylase II